MNSAHRDSVPRPFHERLLPSVPVYVVAAAAALVATLLVLPFSTAGAVVVGLVVLIGLVIALVVTSPVVRVAVPGDDAAPAQLCAGRARIPLDVLGAVQALDGEHLRRLLGTAADGRAWVCHRPWVRSAVRIDVIDPRDSTPYWLVCTRRPGQLATALGRPGPESGHAAHSEQTS